MSTAETSTDEAAEETRTSERAPRRGRVPVTSRDNAPARPKRRLPRVRMGAAELAVLALAALIVLGAVAAPARNYFSGRTEIARLNESIAAKQDRVDELDAELGRWNSEAYAREQARRRLGVIGEGETAYRILDPEMDQTPTVAGEVPASQDRSWLDKLWDSVSVPAEEAGSAASDEKGAIGGGEVDTHMPLDGEAPAEGEQPAEGEAPAAG